MKADTETPDLEAVQLAFVRGLQLRRRLTSGYSSFSVRALLW